MGKPIIGISSSVIVDQGGMFPGYRRAYVNKDYVDSIIKAGGVPLIIPFSEDKEVIKAQSELIDGLLLSGGHDVFPLNYGQEPSQKLGEVFPERDEYDYELFKIAKERKIPVLGICRGVQVMNTYEGGTLYQDLSLVKSEEPVLKHSQTGNPGQRTHSIKIKENSKLREIFGQESILVNSFHHQVLDKVADGYEVTARAADGIIEAIESTTEDFVVGVQWHPEMLHASYELMNNLFKEFVNKSKK